VSSQSSARGMSRLIRRAGLLIALALFTSACVSQGDPKVAVTKVEADLVFGVKEPEPPAEPANSNIDEELPPSAFEPADLPDFGSFDNPDFGKLPLPPAEAPGECPAAPPTAVAEKAVDVNITGLPPVGIYKWQRDGTQKPAGSTEGGSKIDTFERRIVRNVKQVSPTVHTFETVQPDIGGKNVVVTSFRVRTDAINRDSTGAGLPVAGPRVGEPDRGVTITQIENIDSQGNTTSVFTPSTPILILPLPVSSNEEYQSVGVDPRSGQTLTHRAKVLARERVDACGEVVDGWAVEAERTTSSPDAPVVTYRYLVAPQYGGLIISEKLNYSAGGLDNEFLFRLGQVDPDPLPAT
jgi:hypothetical protein